MLKFTDYDIVFQEIPSEVTLAINLSLCPNRCQGCHSPQLWEDIGNPLDEQAIDVLLRRYGNAITCVSLMGGDNDALSVIRLAQYIRRKGYKSAWYSGMQDLPDEIPEDIICQSLDYIKLGPYIEQLGGLASPTTNQRLYHIVDDEFIDITNRLQK